VRKETITVPEPFYSLCTYVENALAAHGFEGYLVGGSVRDLVLNGTLADVDYTTNATPDDVQKIFPRTVPVGIKFGTVLVLYKGQRVEVTTYRADADYTDGRRPDKVIFAKDLATDIKRRDFTVNGLAYSVVKREFKDYCGGLHDIEKKILRTIGDPMARFTEDGLRPIRGCRIAAKHRFTIEDKTREAMYACRHVTARVAPERFYDEWRKTLTLKNKSAFWKNIFQAGIIGAFLPSIENYATQNLNQNFFREIDSYRQRNMASYAASVFYLLRVTDANIQKQTLLETKFPTLQMRLAISLLSSPLFTLEENLERFAFKKELAKIAKAERIHHIRFFLAMREGKMRGEVKSADEITLFRKKIVGFYKSIRLLKDPLDFADLTVNGVDIEHLGITGRAVGHVLHHLLENVLEDPKKNERGVLLNLANHFSKSL